MHRNSDDSPIGRLQFSLGLVFVITAWVAGNVAFVRLVPTSHLTQRPGMFLLHVLANSAALVVILGLYLKPRCAAPRPGNRILALSLFFGGVLLGGFTFLLLRFFHYL
jgi:hypothetical protein